MPVQITTIVEGGKKSFPTQGKIVKIHYEGRMHPETRIEIKNRDNTKSKVLMDSTGYGKIIDSSYTRGEPFEFVMGAGTVLSGIDESLLNMSVGQKVELIMTSEKAFGKTGIGKAIPGEATVIFIVELLGIKNDWYIFFFKKKKKKNFLNRNESYADEE